MSFLFPYYTQVVACFGIAAEGLKFFTRLLEPSRSHTLTDPFSARPAAKYLLFLLNSKAFTPIVYSVPSFKKCLPTLVVELCIMWTTSPLSLVYSTILPSSPPEATSMSKRELIIITSRTCYQSPYFYSYKLLS
jgi:hypothetical protein